MHTIFADTNNSTQSEQGSALVIALIVLAILSVLGFAALDVADLNIFMAANDRDTKEAFFHADSGVNVGRELIKFRLDEGNSSVLENNAQAWVNSYGSWSSNATLMKSLFDFYSNSTKGTYVRAGLLDYVDNPHSLQFNEYMSPGMSLSKSLSPIFLIRGHNEGKRNSRSEVDLAFRDRPLM